MSAAPLSVHGLSPTLAVAGQLGPQDMARAAAMGFRSVVNNRPDHEHGPGQPTHADNQAAAEAAGLTYRFLPVSSMGHSAEQIQAMAALLRELPRPVLMFCRSGARSARLYQEVLQVAPDAG